MITLAHLNLNCQIKLRWLLLLLQLVVGLRGGACLFSGGTHAHVYVNGAYHGINFFGRVLWLWLFG